MSFLKRKDLYYVTDFIIKWIVATRLSNKKCAMLKAFLIVNDRVIFREEVTVITISLLTW